MSLSIGADVGETNTIAVVLKGGNVLCFSQVPPRKMSHLASLRPLN